MSSTDELQKTILNDLQYLVDELEALKYLIDVVPVYERPGDELSVCEHIRLIHFIQDKLSAGAIPSDSNLRSNDLDQFIHEYKLQRSDSNTEKNKGVQHYINKLTQARVGLLSEIEAKNNTFDSGLTSNLIQIIRLERAVFKEMAEKVLAINKES